MLAYRNGTVLNRPRVSTGGGGGSFFRDYLVMTRHPSDTVFLCNVYVPPEGLRTPHTVYHDVGYTTVLPACAAPDQQRTLRKLRAELRRRNFC